jgi:uncharacterized membrane protein (DUF373 family)
MAEMQRERMHPVRARVVGALSLVEDVIYSGLGILLAVYALALLVKGFHNFLQLVSGNASNAQLVDLLDQVLMILLVVELLYTVQVSFREHGLVTEPFLVVGLISVIRRVLVLTAQLPELAQSPESSFRHAVMELILLTLMIVVLVGSLIFLRRETRRMADGGAPGLPPLEDCAAEAAERSENTARQAARLSSRD